MTGMPLEYFRERRLRLMTPEQRIAREQRQLAQAQAAIEREKKRATVAQRRAVFEQSRAARAAALVAGAHTYIGHACKCGGTVRYVANRRCKACGDANSVKGNARMRERRRAAKIKTPEPLAVAGRLDSKKTGYNDREQCTKNSQ